MPSREVSIESRKELVTFASYAERTQHSLYNMSQQNTLLLFCDNFGKRKLILITIKKFLPYGWVHSVTQQLNALP